MLRRYADRGIFRGFSRRSGRGDREEFRFRWVADTTFRLHFDPRRKTLVFKDLLPNVPYPSTMDRAFRSFLEERSSAELPEHRRIDPARVEVTCRNRYGNISVMLEIENEDYAYAARKGVSLVNEIFHGFLRGPYYEYMVRNFNEPEE